MKKEPLKDKVRFVGDILDDVGVEVYFEKDTKSAVEWLKEQQEIIAENSSASDYFYQMIQMITLIDKAFPDLKEK